jgi:hypothetical protein
VSYRSKSVVCSLALLLLSSSQLRAGGPLYVGGSAFDPAACGKGFGWANGQLTYFTDQGNLSPLLDQASANSFVDAALQTWASVPTAALTITHGGSLAEDVNGGNVSSSGVLPADVQRSATDKPLAIVYDNDGQVTEALLGAGASDPALCSTNSVMGGVDNLTTAGNLAHAFVIINGRCALTSTDLVALKYRLLRKFGEVLGLGWSQANDNVRTGTPAPTADDFAGFPIMHAEASLCLLPGSSTCAGAGALRMDDRAALSRLYPVTLENAGQFPGKQVLAEHSIRVSGSVYFSNTRGSRGQPMQGVNVVARLIDPITGLPSGRIVATSVSGFLFHGNAGNEVSGFVAPDGKRFDAFGSADATLEGFYDLAGLELPAGAATASYQISLEAVNPLYNGDKTVGPYEIGPIAPSGDLPSVTVTLSGMSAGADEVQDFLLTGSAKIATDAAEANPFVSPSPVPTSGEWFGSLASYGDSDFYIFTARANRSLDFEVTALNEAFAPTVAKSQPTLGIWLGTDAAGSEPRLLQNSFNTAGTGLTRLGANIFQDIALKLGIADVRGDGRPDFLYQARLLYADRLSPVRIIAPATPVLINGIGFRNGMTATIGGVNAPVLYAADNEIVLSAPALADGAQDVALVEPSSGMTTVMTAALLYGADNGSQLVLLSGITPTTPLGSEASIPVRVRVVAADGVTPVPSIPVTFSVATASLLSPCGASSCSVLSDDSGEAASTVLVESVGANVVTASLSNGARVQTSISGTSNGLVLVAVNPSRFVASGSTVSLSLAVKALNANGTAAAGQQVNFVRTVGSGTLTVSSATTTAAGTANTLLNIAAVGGSTTVVACLSAGACPQFTIQAIAPTNLHLHLLAGDSQILRAGQLPQPILLRVTDSASPSNYAAAVPVAVSEIVVARLGSSTCTPAEGVCGPVTPKIISNTVTTLVSDASGIISFTPLIQSSWGPVQVSVHAAASSTATLDADLRVLP